MGVILGGGSGGGVGDDGSGGGCVAGSGCFGGVVVGDGDIAGFGRGCAELLILFALGFWNLWCSLE